VSSAEEPRKPQANSSQLKSFPRRHSHRLQLKPNSNFQLNLNAPLSSKSMIFVSKPTVSDWSGRTVNGGDLFDVLIQSGAFSEGCAAVVRQQCLIGLKVLQDNRIVLRNLKPENLLLQYEQGTMIFVCKICDFGFAGMFTKPRMKAIFHLTSQLRSGPLVAFCPLC